MSPGRVTLVDYGAGNLPSVERALQRLGARTERASAPEALGDSQAIVLPGVGHFGALMRTLEDRRLLEPLRAALARGTPFLGICLGLQALYGSSEEDPSRPGLGVLAGTVQPLPNTAKLPHMGWNQLRRLRPSVLLRDVPERAYFYFAHSYAALDAGDAAVALCDHGVPFVAVLESGKTMAVQFHPEKSGEAGSRVLHNFLESAGVESAS
jgi:imidazole glycerol phosphate synthase glutamine amidotransferase subunit